MHSVLRPKKSNTAPRFSLVNKFGIYAVIASVVLGIIGLYGSAKYEQGKADCKNDVSEKTEKTVQNRAAVTRRSTDTEFLNELRDDPDW